MKLAYTSRFRLNWSRMKPGDSGTFLKLLDDSNVYTEPRTAGWGCRKGQLEERKEWPISYRCHPPQCWALSFVYIFSFKIGVTNPILQVRKLRLWRLSNFLESQLIIGKIKDVQTKSDSKNPCSSLLFGPCPSLSILPPISPTLILVQGKKNLDENERMKMTRQTGGL